MKDYIDTLVLPAHHVAEAAKNAERKHTSVALDVAHHGARIASLDHSIGKLVDVQVSHVRQIAELRSMLTRLEREYLALRARLTAYAAIGIALMAILTWTR